MPEPVSIFTCSNFANASISFGSTSAYLILSNYFYEEVLEIIPVYFCRRDSAISASASLADS